jgi:hypothetical protein
VIGVEEESPPSKGEGGAPEDKKKRPQDPGPSQDPLLLGTLQYANREIHSAKPVEWGGVGVPRGA